jgi:hypothetical protein
MMRVPSKATEAHRAVRSVWLAAAAVLLAACSSKPIDDPGAASAGAPSSSAGNGPVPSGGSATAPSYQKQDYPAGPYGTGLHATLEDFDFLGWHDPVAAQYDVSRLEQVHLSEYYNPDGRSDTKLIWINASAVWCTVCRSEMEDIKKNAVHATFAPKGVQMIVTLFEDNASGPAKPSDLHNWGSLPAYSIDFPLLLDPGFKLGAFFTSDATPLNMLVDARTMQVVDATMGYSQDYWQRVDQFLTKLP